LEDAEIGHAANCFPSKKLSPFFAEGGDVRIGGSWQASTIRSAVWGLLPDEIEV
jgi:hypothetical protein